MYIFALISVSPKKDMESEAKKARWRGRHEERVVHIAALVRQKNDKLSRSGDNGCLRAAEVSHALFDFYGGPLIGAFIRYEEGRLATEAD
jgi:hypothetical protein